MHRVHHGAVRGLSQRRESCHACVHVRTRSYTVGKSKCLPKPPDPGARPYQTTGSLPSCLLSKGHFCLRTYVLPVGDTHLRQRSGRRARTLHTARVFTTCLCESPER